MFLIVSSHQEALRSIDGGFLFFCCFLTAWKGLRKGNIKILVV